MYRYIVDDAITFTPDDLVLYRESPFAVWMERLTLENPEHGIPPDLDTIVLNAQSLTQRQDDIVVTLRAEGRNVVLIDPEQEEPSRRAATLEAMRVGADFIVSGQLSVGTLSGNVDLLMRTSGFSELGDFLYIPCETHTDNAQQSSFRLCFAADLLANLQGQLPPQMLIIRGGAEVVPLQTEDHIYYYRAVLKRFVTAMDTFRKHRMPDPAESAHFGRWAECASEVLKQRESSGQQQAQEQTAEALAAEEQAAEEASEALVEMPQLRVAGGTGVMAQYDRDAGSRPEFARARAMHAESTTSNHIGVSTTLAEQARLLKPDSFRNGIPPGHTPSLAHIGKRRVVATEPASPVKPTVQPAASEALENLEFIGSSATRATSEFVLQIENGEAITPAPSPNLRETSRRESSGLGAQTKSAATQLPDLEPRPPVFLPPDQHPVVAPPREQLKTHERDSVEPESDAGPRSVIDLDRVPVATRAPVVQRAEAVFERLFHDDPMSRKADSAKSRFAEEVDGEPISPFSNSLKTSEEFNDS